MQKYKLIRTSNENIPEKRSTQFDEPIDSNDFIELGYMMKVTGYDHIATTKFVVDKVTRRIKAIPFESEFKFFD